MNTRKIADMDVSTLCLGTMTIGPPVGKEDAVKIIHWALDHGISFIDTADMYEGYARKLGSHGGVAEKILGQALKGRRDQAIVTTKAGNPVDGPESTFDISARHLSKQIDRSLKYLQFDYLDIFELHRPDDKTPLEESVGAMAEFIKAGKTRYWGFSNFNGDQIRELVKICDTNGFPYPVVSQPPYSWLNREAQADHIPNCRNLNIAVTPYRPLEGGLLTGKYKRGQPLPPGSRAHDGVFLQAPEAALYDQLERFETEAAEAHLAPTAYALKWILDQPGLTSCVVGVKRIEQLEELVVLMEGA